MRRPGRVRAGVLTAANKQGLRPDFTGILSTGGYAVVEFNFQDAEFGKLPYLEEKDGFEGWVPT